MRKRTKKQRKKNEKKTYQDGRVLRRYEVRKLWMWGKCQTEDGDLMTNAKECWKGYVNNVDKGGEENGEWRWDKDGLWRGRGEEEPGCVIKGDCQSKRRHSVRLVLLPTNTCPEQFASAGDVQIPQSLGFTRCLSFHVCLTLSKGVGVWTWETPPTCLNNLKTALSPSKPTLLTERLTETNTFPHQYSWAV